MKHRRLRMAALLALGAAAAGGGALGCGDKKPRVLHLYVWSNYVPDSTLSRFEKEKGCRVEVAHYESNDDLVAKLQQKGTGFDVAVPSESSLPGLVAQGLLERLEKSKIPNASHLDPRFTGRESDPKDEWAVPYAWGTAGLAWRADKLGETVDSWAALTDPRAEKNAFLLAEKHDAIAAALLFAGHDVNTLDPAHLAAAKQVLLGWKPSLKGYTGEVKTSLESGEAWVMQAYNGDFAQARRSRKDIRFAVPKEGGILWTDNLVIPQGAPERDLAHAFLNFTLEPDVAARFSNELLYAVPNKDALPLVKPEVRDDPIVYAPPEVLKRCQREKDLGKDDETYARLWEEVRGGG